MADDLMQKITSLAKRRGFVFPGSEIYGGFANTWDYGPLGAELKNVVKKLWWKKFVQDRADMYGLDASILMNPKVWEASGHVQGFNDALVDCKNCKQRIRADHLIEDKLDIKVEGKTMAELDTIIKDNELVCSNCGGKDLTEPRKFNLLFKTMVGTLEDEKSAVFLRGETAQAMFVNFRNIVDTMRPKLPFGMAQSGKAFRNEITPGNFIFRTLEFEQMEIEYFIKEAEWKKWFEYWQNEMESWLDEIGINRDNIRWREHTKDELSHYSRKTADIEYKYPFGFKEMYGLAYRTDYDLKQHAKFSKKDLEYFDPQTNKKFIPHVIEPTFGADRTMLTLLVDAYTEEEVKGEKRVVLKFDKKVAPIKVAVFPLARNKKELVDLAHKVFDGLKDSYPAMYDASGSIGKLYRRQDEIGTPFCITVDFDSLTDQAVTVRDRDTMEQERVKIDKLLEYFGSRFK
ncbi:glycine--tRNA ligase [Patescibacteria group bacterium]